MSILVMDHHGRNSIHDYQNTHYHDQGTRPLLPQLPGFEHFVRGAGQPDLAYRAPTRPDAAFVSPFTGQHCLPTPPSTNGCRSSWLSVEGQAQTLREVQPTPYEEKVVTPIEAQRRASFAPPLQNQARPRVNRAHSNSSALASNTFADWRHGRVLYEEEIAGKGLCYVYDDGSICPKEINGDVVNPKWGTTKAGRPRKRLGQACNSCRDKKVRCDPQVGHAKCTQCQRSNRECRFEDQSSRQSHRSPKLPTSTASPSTTNIHSPNEYASSSPQSLLIPTKNLDLSSALENQIPPQSGSLDVAITMSSREKKDTAAPSKRQRLDDDIPCRPSENENSTSTRDTVVPERGAKSAFNANTDPILVNLDLTTSYLHDFFHFVNVPSFEILPRKPFLTWATENHRKALHDRLLIYAVLALGTIHSTSPDRHMHRSLFKQIVNDKLEEIEQRYCLQSVHTMIFLSLTEFADAEFQRGFASFVRCVGIIAAMKLNVEPTSYEDMSTYDMSSTMYIECRRRTYWAAFCCDAYSGLSRGEPRLLHNDNIFLRLPCTTDLYNADRIPLLPIFNQKNTMPASLTPQDLMGLGDMSWLLSIAVICSDVQLNVWRCENAHRIEGHHVEDSPYREKLEQRLRDWADGYNRAIRAREGRALDSEVPRLNVETAARAQKFAGLDILYHYANMELYRRIYHFGLTGKQIHTYAKQATMHAVETLRLSLQLVERGGAETRDYVFATRGVLAGYAIFAAVDILTAAGKISDILGPKSHIMSLMYSALELLGTLGQWWASASMQWLQVKERIQLVYNSLQGAVMERKTFFYCAEPMMATVNMEFDLIYGKDRRQYLQAAYPTEKDIKESDIFEIKARDRDTASSSRGSF